MVQTFKMPTYSEIIRLVIRQDDNDLIILPKSRDELRDIPASPSRSAHAEKSIRTSRYTPEAFKDI
jgi:hypothetical protein